MFNKGLMSSNSNKWSTPQKFFDELDKEFHFTLDPCSTHQNAKCKKHYTIEENGLAQSWGGNCLLQPSIWNTTKTLGKKGLARKH